MMLSNGRYLLARLQWRQYYFLGFNIDFMPKAPGDTIYL